MKIYITSDDRNKYMDDDESAIFPKQRVGKLYNTKYQRTYLNQYYVLKNDHIKDTRIGWTYSGRKRRATGYVYLNGSPYCDAEWSSQLRWCLHDVIINADPRIGKKNKLGLYRQCTTRIVKDTQLKELRKCECVSSVINIEPVLNTERDKMGNMGILLKIDDGVYVCICTVYTEILKKAHNTHLSMIVIFKQNRRVNAVVQSLIIYHMHQSV